MTTTATRTDRSHTHEITGESLPLVKLILPRWDHSPLEVIQVEGESYYYSQDGTGQDVLYRQAVQVDHGGNIYQTRTAPTSLVGINAGEHKGSVPTRVSYRQPVYFLEIERAAN